MEAEETRFARTLDVALSKLDDLIEHAVEGLGSASNQDVRDNLGDATDNEIDSLRKRVHMLDGEKAFALYDTFGLPIDFIQDAARDAGIEIDQAAFDDAMEEQRTRARASWKGGGGKEAVNPAFAKIAETFKTEKDFYHGTSTKDCANRSDTKQVRAGQRIESWRNGRSGAGPHRDLRRVRRTDGRHGSVLR